MATPALHPEEGREGEEGRRMGETHGGNGRDPALAKCTVLYTVKNLRTLCCTQVTKTKDSYLYKNSSSAEIRWRAGDWVTARELSVLATDYGLNDMFSGCTVSPSPAHHLAPAAYNVLATECG